MIRKRMPRRRIALAVAVCAVGLLILVFYLQHLTETARMGLIQRDLENTLSRLREEVRTLEARKAALLSLARVEKVAREDLKMAEPAAGQIVYESPNEPHK
jgi:cell division protein FtsL